MNTYQLPMRKADFLDELNALRYERRLAYECGNIERARELNLEMKELRLSMGWSDADALEELEKEIKEFERPFIPPVENPLIRYDLNDENGKARGLSLTIHQVNKYWSRRDGGMKHREALSEALKPTNTQNMRLA